jgi:N-acetylglucosamine kinase-like BadF-type ATPase
VQKGVYYSGIRIFNNLPQSIRDLSSDVINFKQAQKKFLLLGSFYSLNEYYEWNMRDDLGSYK